jgi:molybdenum cofactor biosynthesis enzyme MoaA
MGCLDHPDTKFDHWSSNIHFSGPCNLDCYYCIGQFMPHLENYNSLNTAPEDMAGLDRFIEEVTKRGISEVTLTGTNTDPLLYKHIPALAKYLRERIPDLRLGIVTNGQTFPKNMSWLSAPPTYGEQALAHTFQRVVLSVPTFDPDLYRQIEGGGKPPGVWQWRTALWHTTFEVNVILLPEVLPGLWRTVAELINARVPRVNLREPYGFQRAGNPMMPALPDKHLFGQPQYSMGTTVLTYWDVYRVQIQSVNLFANGRVTTDYAVTRGYHPDGKVIEQL